MNPTTRDVARAAVFTALIAAAAHVTIPAGPVPFTLQELMVLLAGLVLGSRLGALAAAAYVVLGLVAPVYAGGTSGLGVLAGPTGGYLVGFVAAAALTGALVGNARRSLRRTTLAACAGLVPIYGLGATWLALQLETTDWRVVLVGGVLQFLPLDLVKAVLAAVLARGLVSLPLAAPAPGSDR